ncbi:hypothetical protein OAS14_02695 [Alphaproteobacteria bacterium]|nr:hypothetical protein [Alphaproteobacteria bacterium]
MKQRSFMPFTGGLGKLGIGLCMVGCTILALIFFQFQTGCILHLRFAKIVCMKLTSANKHKQDGAKRQNQLYFVKVLKLAEGEVR